MEIFKDIKGYEGLYQVSNLGRVKSLDKKVFNGLSYWLMRGKILKQNACFKGYKRVTIYKNKKPKTFLVHRLIAMAFLGYKGDDRMVVVDHINNIKGDNRLINLQVISNRENTSKDKTNKTSKYTGVSLTKKLKYKKWRATIRINGKVKELGYYKTEIGAANAYTDKLKEINNG